MWPIDEILFLGGMLTVCAFITYTIHEVMQAVISWYEEW